MGIIFFIWIFNHIKVFPFLYSVSENTEEKHWTRHQQLSAYMITDCHLYTNKVAWRTLNLLYETCVIYHNVTNPLTLHGHYDNAFDIIIVLVL